MLRSGCRAQKGGVPVSWREYRDSYQSYELSVSQSRMLTIVAREALRDFPSKLPKSIRKPLAGTMSQVEEFLGLAEPKSEDRPAPERIEMDLSETHEIAKAALSMYLARANLGIPSEDLDFERALCSQELVMVFAHIDTFMCDTVETMCRVCPKIMKSRKSMDWDTIISLDGWEELLDHMIEMYVFQFGWKSVPQRVEFLREEIGLNIDFTDAELGSVAEAENLRHVVVHNGGRASEEYLKRSGREDVALGELLPIPPVLVEEAYEATRTLAGHLFLAVSEKFFGKDSALLPGVWRRRRANAVESASTRE
jgi:hypothetical protein